MGIEINSKFHGKLDRDEYKVLTTAMEMLNLYWKYEDEDEPDYDCPMIFYSDVKKLFESGLIPSNTTLFRQMENIIDEKDDLKISF